jgi:subtilisin family serine protease
VNGTVRGALTLAVALALVAVASGAQAGTVAANYIVKLADPPVAGYTGGVAGLAATNPAARGEVKLDASSPASRAYAAYLDARRQAVATAARAALGHDLAITFTYRYAYNGFATKLTETEAAALARLPGVADVQPEFTRHLVTDAGPAWIGATAVWGGTGGPKATKGEGVVVGDVDSGINFKHPSFADVGGDGYDHTNPRGKFYGLCDPVLGKPYCNDKLIGVWDFSGGTGVDDNGHGSHTASTAVGNAHSATLNTPTITITRPISGVAPHANLITYKACLATGSCVSESLVAAIDQAVADGVDVINYSIGGGPTDPWDDADSDAFLGARAAGIFVSASAGNDGPGAETVGSPANSPWVMSIGASTHNRAFVNSLTGMSGGAGAAPADIRGRSLTAGYGPARIVYAGDYGHPLCGEGPASPEGSAAVNPFTPGTFHGEIVVCDRGVYGRVEKAQNVQEGGAGGFVLANDEPSGDSLVGDAYPIPGVHITYRDGLALKAWLAAGTGHTASISGTTVDTSAANGDVMAAFSSRGPNKPAPSIIKPDVTAPGVDVLAAISPSGLDPEYGILSGTSMSSPHATGAAALVRALHPDWTPAEVQSAIVSTAKTTGIRKEDGTTAADPFDMGGGRIDLTQAGRAGLVLDETADNFTAANPAEGGDPSRLNLATLANTECNAFCTWTRTVTNALTADATWTAKTVLPQGVKLSVKPSRLTLHPGDSVTLTITADTRSATVGKWLFGGVILSAKGAPDQHLTLALVPGKVQPVSIQTTSTTGSQTVPVTTPIAVKDLSTRVYGLTKGVFSQLSLTQDPTPLDPYDGVAGTSTTLLDVAAGSQFLAAEIASTTATDLDLFVGRDTNGDGVAQENEELCRSASDTAMEACTLRNLSGGKYWVLVQDWLTGRALDDVSLLVSTVPGTSAGNLTATGPKTAAAGSTFDVTLAWNEPKLAVGETWFGLVDLGSDARSPGNVRSLLVKLTRTG